MREPIRYNATKIVGEYGEQARLQHRLHLSPDAKGKWVKWEDYRAMRVYLILTKGKTATPPAWFTEQENERA